MPKEPSRVENHWFSEKDNNWPDFRTNSQSTYEDGDDYEDDDAFRYAIAWCHGSPGIGLSRLYAYKILKKEEYMRDCRITKLLKQQCK